MSYYSEMLEVELKRNREAQKVFLDNLGEKRSSYVGIIESPEVEEAMKKADDVQYIKDGLKKLQADEQKLMKAIEVLK